MLENLGLTEQDVATVAMGAGAFLGALFLALRGARRGHSDVGEPKPPRCAGADIRDEIAELRRDVTAIRDAAARIEGRISR